MDVALELDAALHMAEVLVRHAQHVETLAARGLNHPPRHFSAASAIHFSFASVVTPAVDTRHDAECPIMLDVGVDVVVDEARGASVQVLDWPSRFEQRGAPQPCCRRLPGRRQDMKHIADDLQSCCLPPALGSSLGGGRAGTS